MVHPFKNQIQLQLIKIIIPKFKAFAQLRKYDKFEVVLEKTKWVQQDGVWKVVQKGVDTRLALDLVAMAQDPKRKIDVIILVAGDDDFEPPVRYARRTEIEIILCPSDGKGSGKKSHFDDLLRLCSSYKFIDQNLINRCFYV
jgi:uncharacterized LabA/DUF88 family protein